MVQCSAAQLQFHSPLLALVGDVGIVGRGAGGGSGKIGEVRGREGMMGWILVASGFSLLASMPGKFIE